MRRGQVDSSWFGHGFGRDGLYSTATSTRGSLRILLTSRLVISGSDKQHWCGTWLMVVARMMSPVFPSKAQASRASTTTSPIPCFVPPMIVVDTAINYIVFLLSTSRFTVTKTPTLTTTTFSPFCLVFLTDYPNASMIADSSNPHSSNFLNILILMNLCNFLWRVYCLLVCGLIIKQWLPLPLEQSTTNPNFREALIQSDCLRSDNPPFMVI